MGDEPNWIQVLEVMYDEADYQSLESLLENDHNFDLSTNKEQLEDGVDEIFPHDLGTTGLLLVIALENLQNIGLVKRHIGQGDEDSLSFRPDTRFVPTEAGFRVAHDRKLQRQQREVLNQTNKAYWIIAGLTVILAVGEAINAAVALGYVG